MMDKKRLSQILANLRRADPSNADLRNADVSNADLRYADLRNADLRYADLSNADASGADLRFADLSRADLRNANLRNANLRFADLSNAHLNNANLRYADLHYAHLSFADLSYANLDGAILDGTCLDTTLIDNQRRFVRECPPVGRHGGRIVWRTAKSKFVGATAYRPGRTYIAPVVSADVVTACHPGIYASSKQWFEHENYDDPLVRCYVRDGDWFITAKGAIRCKRLRVLSEVAA